MQTPDGRAKLELTKFHTPADDEGAQPPPPNRLGIRHITFAVDDLDDVIERLQRKGFDTVVAVQNYEDILRLCLISGPEGIIVELAEPYPSARRTG